MFFKMFDLLKCAGGPVAVTLNRRHAYLNGAVYGLPYGTATGILAAMFSCGYHSSSTGRTHYGNFAKWTICGTPSPVFYIKGKEVTCKKCKRLFDSSFPINVIHSSVDTDAVPMIALSDARVKYSQRGFFREVFRHAYRINNGRWRVSRIHDGRKESTYDGQPLRVMLSQPLATRDEYQMITYYLPNNPKDVGLTFVSLEQEVPVKDRVLIVPSSLCLVTIRKSSKYITMPFDHRAVRQASLMVDVEGSRALNSLLSDWKVYKSYQEVMIKVIRGEIKPLSDTNCAYPSNGSK